MTSDEPRTCPNCESMLAGPFCHNCGQKDEPLRQPLSHILHEVLHDVFHLDARVLHTVRPLLLKPGFLPREHEEGRRARYVPPFRLYIFSSFILFLVLGLTPTLHSEKKENIHSDLRRTAILLNHALENPDLTPAQKAGVRMAGAALASVEPEIQKEQSVQLEVQGLPAPMARSIQKIVEDPEKFQESLKHNIPKIMFVLLPGFGLLLHFLYIRSDRYYLQHFIFSLYFHAFAFVTITLINLLGLLGSWTSLITSLLALSIPAYLGFAMLRVYGQGWLKTAVKYVFLCGTYLVLVGISMLGLVILTAITF